MKPTKKVNQNNHSSSTKKIFFTIGFCALMLTACKKEETAERSLDQQKIEFQYRQLEIDKQKLAIEKEKMAYETQKIADSISKEKAKAIPPKPQIIRETK
jgi:hypothetical protein